MIKPREVTYWALEAPALTTMRIIQQAVTFWLHQVLPRDKPRLHARHTRDLSPIPSLSPSQGKDVGACAHNPLHSLRGPQEEAPLDNQSADSRCWQRLQTVALVPTGPKGRSG